MAARLASKLGPSVLVVAFGGAACAARGGLSTSGAPRVDADPSRAAPPAALRTAGLYGLDDPTVHGARLLPAGFGEAHTWGVEPGGGVRAVVGGLRIVSFPGGELAASTDRLPGTPSSVTALPERLGGGFVLALGTHLWRSQTWLGAATPIFTWSAPIGDVLVGLDRLYVRAAQGPLIALDPRPRSAESAFATSLDLGPLPRSPRVVSIAALDAWRAVAIADLRGALLTLDAGATWRPIGLPIDTSRALAMPDGSFAIGGVNAAARAMQWWDVLPDGQPAWLASSPPGNSGPSDAEPPGLAAGGAAPLGAHPLQAAVEDGWPMTDGTALVARDGALFRVRLADGAVLEVASAAFALEPARCHPLSLARSTAPTPVPGVARSPAPAGASPVDRADPAAFGFVCGESRGRTAIYRWEAATSRLVELRRFDTPRVVVASGNGALAVRGPCAADADASRAGDGAYCVMGPRGDWSEIHFAGPEVDRARIVVLSSGRIAVVRPPEDGDLSTARLTVAGAVDGAAATHVPLRFPPALTAVARALRLGVWMDGFEERRPGVLGGWIDAAGSILGVEVGLDGAVRVGEYISDAGAPVASGRWAFGWTASGGGFETTDGGMSWTKEIPLPQPIAEPRAARDRSCGPIGCVTAGWLRIGWGFVETPSPPDPPPLPLRPSRRSPSLTLDCDPSRAVDARSPFQAASPIVSRLVPLARAGAVQPLLPSRPPLRAFSFGGNGGAVTAFRPFVGRASPAIPTGELGLSIDASHWLDRGPRSRMIARVYGWGSSAGDWDASGRWQVLWAWPWQGATSEGPDTRSSAIGPAPWTTLDAAARAIGTALGLPPEWTLVSGDDPDHALLVARRSAIGTPSGTGGLLMLVALESDRIPVDVRRVDGEPLPDLQGAVWTSGHWYVASAQLPGEPAATVLWRLDGSVAREMGRAPRVAPELSGPVRLARRVPGTGSSPVGILVTGPDSDPVERLPSIWVSSFDPEAHAFEEPERLGPADLSDRTVAPCTGDDGGWQIEAAFPGSVDVHVGSAWSSRIQAPLARLRVSATGACVEHVFGAVDPQGPQSGSRREGLRLGTTAPPLPERAVTTVPLSARTLGVTVVTEQTRAELRCRTHS